MKRYCIVCENMFGCTEGGRKHECSDCDFTYNCRLKNDPTRSHITGGICQSCWEKRQIIKMATKIYNIAKRLNLNPAHSGIKSLVSGSS
jgi:hypothetical protein